MGAPVNEESVLDLQASRSQMTSDTDELLALRDALRACPKCQSEEFTDRRVTRARVKSARVVYDDHHTNLGLCS
jgi:hypothetical protein